MSRHTNAAIDPSFAVKLIIVNIFLSATQRGRREGWSGGWSTSGMTGRSGPGPLLPALEMRIVKGTISLFQSKVPSTQ